MNTVKEFQYTFKVGKPSGRLECYASKSGTYIDGNVFTPHGIVHVFWSNKDHYELWFLTNGVMHVRNVTATGRGTKKELTALAGEWADVVMARVALAPSFVKELSNRGRWN